MSTEKRRETPERRRKPDGKESKCQRRIEAMRVEVELLWASSPSTSSSSTSCSSSHWCKRLKSFGQLVKPRMSKGGYWVINVSPSGGRPARGRFSGTSSLLSYLKGLNKEKVFLFTLTSLLFSLKLCLFRFGPDPSFSPSADGSILSFDPDVVTKETSQLTWRLLSPPPPGQGSVSELAVSETS